MEDIFLKLLAACKPDQIRDVIIAIGKTAKFRFEPVGGRKNNLATINIGTDPAAGVTERITNAIDAVLEKEWVLQEKPENIKSPRRAAELWYDIEDGRLSKIKDPNDSRLKKLSSLVTVTLLDSGQPSKPTVEIRDKGIGIMPDQFSKTILELNGGNKIGKLHLMGAYGQGGSTALAWNSLTVIISKSALDNDKKYAAWTIVRINQGDVNTDKHGWYEYLVDSSTGNPFVVEIPDKIFESGTLVRHIMMDLGKYKGKITTPSNSLWYLAHNYLFDPILPFTIADRRGDAKENRMVTGNNRLLTFTENLEYNQKVNLTFKDGKVVIYYWVLNALGDGAKDRIRHYTQVSQPIIITFNGQKQGVLGNGIIKDNLKLPFLDRYLIVQIEADNMDNESKRQLFSSTRESLKETSILEELKKLTIDTLAEDDKLKELDRDRKKRYFTQEDTHVLDSLRKRLARRITSYLQSAGSGTSVTAKSAREKGDVENLPPISIEEPPTLFEITTKSPKEVYLNKTFSIKFKTDAHPNYFVRPETFVAFIEPHSFGMFTGTAKVNDGYGWAYFKTNDDTSIGDVGKITLELRPPSHKSFSATIDVVAVENPETSNPNNSGKNKTPNIDVSFVYKTEPFFAEKNWDENSVAEVTDDQDGVIIWVSAENKNLNKLVVRAQRQNAAAVENIKNKYLEHISFYAFLINQNKPEKFIAEGDEPLSEDVFIKMQEATLQTASETVCGMINDFFEPIITESITVEEE